MKKLFLILLLSISATFAAGVFNPNVEIKINGLVCPSCAIGLKNSFKKNNKVKTLKIDTKKGTLSLEYWGAEIHPSKIKKIVKDSGYEVASIKWLKKKQPNRYNKP